MFAGVNLSPNLAWSHDVDGYGPTFNEGSKAVSVGLDADYRNTYTVSLSYTDYFGGDFNTDIDRDNLSLSVGVTFDPGAFENMKAYAQFTSASLALMLLASSVMAAVSPQQADQLGTSLTPLARRKKAMPMAAFRPGPAGCRKMPARWAPTVSSPTLSPVRNRC